jgi:hypothetical protein
MFPLTQHYWSTYIAYINDASLWIAFIPCLILWIYYYKTGKYVQSLFVSLPFSLFATVLFWSKW